MIPDCADGSPALVPAFVQDADPLPPPDVRFNGAIQIHFGYNDGFSQPRIQGAPWDDANKDEDALPVPAYYFAIAKNPPAYRAHDLLVNGSFGAFRLLYQDVGAFNHFIASSGTPDLVAAKMCGRWLDGTPLVVSPEGPDPSLEGDDYLNFNYLSPTPNQKGPRKPAALGAFCPYAAHTRRTNPRDDTAVKFNTDLAQNHRVRRFATPYGPAYTPETADAPRGLVGLFMGASLGDQFEFLMNSWMEAGSFRFPDASPNNSGVDPVFGTHASDGTSGDFEFAYNEPDPAQPGVPNYVTVPDSMQRFIVTKGGLYVFLPSITALSYIAQGILPPSS
jgi:deferrochelatase/peroxidase EfeB